VVFRTCLKTGIEMSSCVPKSHLSGAVCGTWRVCLYIFAGMSCNITMVLSHEVVVIHVKAHQTIHVAKREFFIDTELIKKIGFGGLSCQGPMGY